MSHSAGMHIAVGSHGGSPVFIHICTSSALSSPQNGQYLLEVFQHIKWLFIRVRDQYVCQQSANSHDLFGLLHGFTEYDNAM
jgi:hypothetical protein